MTQLESLLTERVGLVRRPTTAGRDAARRRSTLALLTLAHPLLANVQVRCQTGSADSPRRYSSSVRNGRCVTTSAVLITSAPLFFFSPTRQGSGVFDGRVCLWMGLCCGFVGKQISETARPNFTKFYVHIIRGPGLIILSRRCIIIGLYTCTSVFCG